MQAWRVHEHGDPADVLRLETVDDPVPDPGDVVIEVRACALNFADDLLCRGTYQERPPLPLTPGLEVSGVVVRSGSDSGLAVGDRVAGSPSLPDGGFAERCRAHGEDVFRIPDRLPDVEAAAMHVTYQSAWFGLYRRAHLRAGETLLVHAGAGGVGSAAIQLGVAAGSRVIATAGGPDKVEVCRSLGADLVLDHRRADVVEEVRAATGGRGADVVFDPVGGTTYDLSRRCIAWEGRIVVVGAAGGQYAQAPTNHLLVKNYSVVGLNWGGYRSRQPDLVRGAHDDLMRLHREGRIRPLVSRTVSLAELPSALGGLVGGKTVGKVVVEP
jgi:NADPH:quinone reductase